jgi:hypothetical protein
MDAQELQHAFAALVHVAHLFFHRFQSNAVRNDNQGKTVGDEEVKVIIRKFDSNGDNQFNEVPLMNIKPTEKEELKFRPLFPVTASIPSRRLSIPCNCI